MKATPARTRLSAVAVTFALLALAPLSTTGAVAAKQPPATTTEIIRGPYLVAEVESGRVIEHFDALRPWYPASTTKLMTIYVTFRAVLNGEIKLDSQIFYSANAAAQPASKMGFKPGTLLTLDNALKMMMVKSANDIAVAVAEAVGGSVDGFANRMNEEARRLGMTRSHWVNPNGLPDENQYTTARDMALVARALLTEFPERRDYFKLHAIQIGGKVLKNFNSLLDRYPGANGMKTGFICASGYNLVASARRGAREVVAVVFGEYGGKARTERAAKLLDDGFASSPPHTEPILTLAQITSGEVYQTPLDMRPYVCGAKRPKRGSEANADSADGDESVDVSHLTASPLYLGPPVQVSALVPLDLGDPGFVAPLPRPRPTMAAGEPKADALDAYAPGEDGASASPPAAAIGAAAGTARPLDNVAPQ